MKTLETNGKNIRSFKVEQVLEENVPVVHLTIESDSTYKYRFCKDVRYPDLATIEANITAAMNESIKNFSNLSVKKFEERNYLYFNGEQYTGKQLM